MTKETAELWEKFREARELGKEFGRQKNLARRDSQMTRSGLSEKEADEIFVELQNYENVEDINKVIRDGYYISFIARIEGYKCEVEIHEPRGKTFSF